MRKKLAFAIATFFGVGYCPKAPGTAGSAAALPLVFACAYLAGFWGVLAAAIVVFFVGFYACREVLKHTGHDPGFIVIDEVAGMLVTFLPVAAAVRREPGIAWWLCPIGFALFRMFDILKPWPAGWADGKILNAWGVMLDDVFAGLWACLAWIVLGIAAVFVYMP